MAGPVINSTQVLRFRGPEEFPGLRAEKDSSFNDIFKKALNDASDIQAESQRLIEAFVRGEPVEIHQVMAAAEEAAISLELLVRTGSRRPGTGELTPMMDFFQRSSGTRRFFIFAVAAVVMVGIWGVGRWASAPMYVALYQDLEFKEAADIDASLQGAGIPHKLAAGGTEVQVPASEVAHARVALAKDGHSMGGRPGLELFDKPAWGMTDFAQRVTFQRALEGELARTVSGLKGIERAQVHLALPSPSPLRRMQRPASASVVLTLDGGSALSSETVQGITFVVSNSVELLTADNVAVMDASGRLLSVPSGDGAEGGGASSRQVEMQRATEAALVAKIENLLEPVLGRGKVHAEVSAELDFDKVDRTVETIGGVVSDASGEPVAEASVGAPADSPDAVNSRELKRSEGSVGKLVRLTAAVVVDQAAVGGAAPEAGEEAAAEPGLRMEQVETMVRNAIGIDDARGDRLTVMAVPFEAAATVEMEPGAGSDGSGLSILRMAEQWVRPLVGLAAIIALVVFALKALRLQASRPVMAAPAVSGGPETAPHAVAAMGGGLPGAPGGQQPEVDLQVVRSWLKDS